MKEIKLKNGLVAIVDDSDYQQLNKWRWHTNGFYPVRHVYTGGKGKIKTIYMHFEIMRPPPGMVVDHIDGDTLNNRRENLKVVDGSGINFFEKGITQKRGKWRAQICRNGMVFHLGYFQTPRGAAMAYANAKKLEHLPNKP